MGTVAQRSFAGGEISPSLYARVDVVKYTTGLRTCRNFYVKRSGGIDSRPGTKYIVETKDSTKRIRLLPFIFNAEQTYVLEFGDYYIRFIQNAEQIEVSGVAAYVGGTTYSIGDLVVDVGVNYYSKTDSNAGNTPASSPDEWYALTNDIYEIPSPYAEADLQELNVVQSADVVVITHQSYPVYELKRFGNTKWTLPIVSFAPSIDAPTGLAVDGGSGTTDEWVVTSIKEESYEESLATASVGSSAKATTGSPRTLSWTAVDGAGEYNVYKKLNGVFGFIGVAGELSFKDDGIPADTTDSPPEARNPFEPNPIKTVVINSGGSGYTVNDILTIVQTGGSEATIKVTSVAAGVVDGFEYVDLGKGYSIANGVATSGGTGTLCTVDITELTTSQYPATAGYYQQRLSFANTVAEPEKIWMSKSGFFRNFTTSAPLQDDDAVTFNMAGRRVNAVRQIVDLGTLIVLSADAEWQVQGDAAGVVRPGEINAKTQSYNGCASLKPILINDNALYIQARGNVVRDLFASIESTGNIGYKGTDLTIFADHLFKQGTIVDWDYAQTPNSLVWCIRSDGIALGFTYLREHQIWAWSRHDTDGLFENVVTVPEGDEDISYFVINRTINGVTKRYIERMDTRKIDDVVDFIGMDATYTYDGRNTTATTMELTGSGWTYADTLNLEASVASFALTDVGDEMWMPDPDDSANVIRCEITAYIDTTNVSVRPNRDVPASLQAVAITNWEKAITNFTDLLYLEGKEVSVMGNGFVVGNPNNSQYPTYTVASGEITIDKPYSVVHIGIPYICDAETLDIDSTQADSLADKKKIVMNVTLFIEKSRGIWVGSRPPSDDDTDPLEGLEEFKARDDEPYDDPIELKDDQIEVKNRPEWNNNGRVFVRQVDPIPLTLLACMPAGLFPFTKGG